MADIDRTGELAAVLEVLAEYVDQTPDDDPDLYDSEFLTACWQVVELVTILHQEHLDLKDRMYGLIVALEKERGRALSLILDAADEETRALIRERD